MVRQILGIRAEAKIHALRQLEGLVHTQVHCDQSRPMEDVSPQRAKAFERRGPSRIGWIGEERVWRAGRGDGARGCGGSRGDTSAGNSERDVASVNITNSARHALKATPNPIVVYKDAIGGAAFAIGSVQV